MANLGDILSVGKQGAELVTGIVGGIGKTLQDLGIVSLNEEQKAKIQASVTDEVMKYNDQLIEVYKLETADIQNARAMQTGLLVDAPKWIKGISALVVPYGGVMALSIFFFNILAPNIGLLFGIPLQKVEMSVEESITVDGIIGFFFVYRWRSKLAGVAGKY